MDRGGHDRCFEEVTSEKDEEPGENGEGKTGPGRGGGVCKGRGGKDLARCGKSWCARGRASKREPAQARLAWEAGSQFQVGGDVILVLMRAIWMEDTDS